MQNTTKMLTALTLAGTMAFGVMTSTTLAKDNDRGNISGWKAEHYQQMAVRGPGGFVNLICSDRGAARMEKMLGRLPHRLELNADQQALYDAFKTAALTAQTEFADKCAPAAAESGRPDPLARLKTRQAEMSAMVTAMDQVIPVFEAFFNSLDDQQKAALSPGRKGNFGGEDHQGGQGMHDWTQHKG